MQLQAIVEPLSGWFRIHARPLPWRENPTAYRVWVSEIMLQQTRAAAVVPYFERFIKALPDVKSLAAADDALLLKLWEGLGYYSRARNLRRAARQIVDFYGGAVPADVPSLLKLPGVGPYTAGAIASIACGQRVPAVDGNVLRVLTRLLNDPSDISDPKTRRRFEAALLDVLPPNAGEFNQALMELGALLCAPNGAPQCDVCPLRELCLAHAAGTEKELPVRKQKAPRRAEEFTVLVWLYEGAAAVKKRPDFGLLASLWELPNVPGHILADTLLSRFGLSPAGEISVGHAKHIFTHVQWNMRVVAARAPDGALPPAWEWMPLAGDFHALPSAFKACIAAVVSE